MIFITLPSTQYLIIGACALVAIILLAIILKKPKKQTQKVVKTEPTEQQPVVEETVEEESAEETVEEEIVEETFEQPEVEETVEEEIVEETVEEEIVEETVEEPVVEETIEEESTEETIEEPTTEEVEEKVDTRYSGKFVITKEVAGYKYNLRASNGENLITSEPYTSLKGAKTGIETLKKNAERIHIVDDKHGLNRFVISTASNRVIAQSANYKDAARATKASESFLKFVKTNVIIFDEEFVDSSSEVDKTEVEAEANGKFVISEEEGNFSYVLKAANGVVICTSHRYKSLSTCTTSISKFQEVVYTGDFVIHKDKNDNYQFKLYNAQGRLVASGEVYKTRQACVNVVESIKRYAKLATIEE